MVNIYEALLWLPFVLYVLGLIYIGGSESVFLVFLAGDVILFIFLWVWYFTDKSIKYKRKHGIK